VATGSLRRKAQLLGLRPDLRFSGLRGNIATRLARLGEFDAIVMAKAALDRLALRPDIVDVLEPHVMLPQVGQGALAIECRVDDPVTRAALAAIEHAPSRRVVDAERAFLDELGGDCDLPAGAHATIDGDVLAIEGLLASMDGHVVLRERRQVPVGEGEAAGRALARYLLDDAGGASLLTR
jgi:hydroxymethylbilane synthase